jgi:nicotinate-nucleotide pyrophosphorylase (carboxylating)
MTELGGTGPADGGTSLDGYVDGLVARALDEDVGPGDWTTQWTVAPAARGSASIVAKAPLVVAGTAVARRVFAHLDDGVDVKAVASDGARLQPEDVALRLTGPVGALLTGERVALNFLGHLSGVATLTRRFVDAVSGTNARIIDTRKTTPGWRVLEKRAVVAGGGANHRMGLYDMVMIKDNHVVAAGGITAAVERVRAHNTAGLPVEVEVSSLEELDELLPLEVDRILLDNMTLTHLRAAVDRARAHPGRRPELEASGNVSLDTVRAVAETGVDLISVGALTHSAPTADLSMRVDR